jgi:hypothetical protein
MGSNPRKIINGLIEDPEVLQKANEYYTLAKVRTAQGSGHAIGKLNVGLSAACALLASETYAMCPLYSSLI